MLADPEQRWLQPNVVALSIRPEIWDDGTAYAAMIRDATQRLRTALAPEQMMADPTFVAWPQMWGSSACGFNAVGTDALTIQPTFVWRIISHPVHVVYHNYHWAYTLLRPRDRFYAAVATMNLPGAADTTAVAALES